ncbi:hypothetical protein AA313_de0202724 [Arthrobotrys entomopaga]|nr:hypothetical protein AA313_de0202724 [Arthrobotrys entomopaga]
MAAAEAMLDVIHHGRTTQDLPNDNNSYIFGSIGSHNIVIACLPLGGYGTTWATFTASRMQASFPSITYYLMVSIGSGVPQHTIDIRLGDVVVSTPTGGFPGVVQYDFKKKFANGHFNRISTLNKPPLTLLYAANKLRADHKLRRPRLCAFISEAAQRHSANVMFTHPGQDQDQLFEAAYSHAGGNSCDGCDISRLIGRNCRTTLDPVIHYGTIASGNEVMKDSVRRDLIARDCNALCFEMEAAALMDNFPCIVVRGICDYSDSHKNKQWQDYAAVVAAAYAKELLLAAVPATGALNELSMDDVDSKLLKSFSFLEIDNRRENIAKPIHGTCDWLFYTQEFQEWQQKLNMKENSGVLWIKGKPGTGKSTLVKHAFRYCNQWFHERLILAYFFNARSSSRLEKSFEGLLRSTIYQILDKGIRYRSRFRSRFLDKERKHNSGKWSWSVGELAELLFETIADSHQSIVLFVDALDECEYEEVRKVVAYLEELSVSAADAQGPGTLRICLSSRHYPTITMKRHLQLVVESQPDHNGDIAVYIQKKIKIRDISIESELRAKAQGVFLWVVLVVELLNRAFDEGDIRAVKKQLNEIPNELDEVFLLLLEKKNLRKQETTLLLQWVLFAQEKLSPRELYLAIQAGVNPDNIEQEHQDMWKLTDEWIERFVISVSRGLVEIIDPSPQLSGVERESKEGYTQFIHETVRDFLLRNSRLRALDPTLGPDIVGISHERLAHCCFSYIANKDLITYNQKPISPGDGEDPLSSWNAMCKKYEPLQLQFPFIHYAVNHIFYHAQNAQGEKVDPTNLLTRVYQNPEAFEALKAIHDFIKEKYEQCHRSLYESEGVHADLLYALVVKGCTYLVQQLLRDYNIDVNAERGFYGNAIYAAIHTNIETPGRFFDLIRVLIDAGAKINATGPNNRSPLQEAVMEPKFQPDELFDYGDMLGVFRQLVRAGANINGANKVWGGLLHAVAMAESQCYWTCTCHHAPVGEDNHEDCISTWSGHFFFRRVDMVMFEGLINIGVDVNIQGGMFANALQAAATHSSCDSESALRMLEMLLFAGAEINMQGGHYGNALQAVAAYAIDAGVDELDLYNSEKRPEDRSRIPLRAPLDVLEMLLDSGADVNLTGGYYGSVLQAAIASAVYAADHAPRIYDPDSEDSGDEQKENGIEITSAIAFIKRLLGAGADVNAQGGFYGNPLQASIFCSALKDPFEAIQQLYNLGVGKKSDDGFAAQPFVQLLNQPLNYWSRPYGGLGLQFTDMLLEAGACITTEPDFNSEEMSKFKRMRERLGTKSWHLAWDTSNSEYCYSDSSEKSERVRAWELLW